jgi:hypothetical protein
MPYRPAIGVESDRIMVKIMLPGGQFWAAGIVLLSVTCAAAAAEPDPAVTGSIAADALPVAVDWRTGLAIHGMDPVSYFSEGHPVEGRGALELRHAGAVWRFRSEANRAAFAADPEIYMPRFAGNDAVAFGRGVVLDGNPNVWLTFGQRLYLFHTPQARAAFLADPRGAIARAEAAAAGAIPAAAR